MTTISTPGEKENDVGKIHCTSAKVQIEWEIPHFFNFYYRNISLESEAFNFLGAWWSLLLIMKKDYERMRGSLYLGLRNPTSSYSVTFSLSIKDLESPFHFGPESRIFDKTNYSHGQRDLFSIIGGYCFRVRPNYGTFSVFCTAAEHLPSTACQTTSSNRTTTSCLSFENLLLTGRKSDVTIAVRGKEFKAHKLILEANSPVFAAMFENDMIEKKTSFINVEDCDPDIFQNFLQFLYAGKVDDLPVDKVIRLYMIAHKYTVTEIMKTCVGYMEENMNAENVLNVHALAKKYNERRLIESAEEFIPQNMHKIISTSSWNTLTQENLLLQEDGCVKRQRITK